MEDREVIVKIKNGEIDNYYYIVKKYTSQILNFVRRKLFNQNEVDDIVQNTFLNFYKAINNFDEKKPVLPYIFEIARNEIKMYFRSKKKTISLDESLLVEDNKIEWYKQDINDLFKTLSKEQKKSIEMLIDGFSYKEIAMKLKKPINTVRSIIRRARLTVQKKGYET